MSYQVIHQLLDAQLATVPGLPSFQAENKRTKAGSTSAFSRSTLLPARPDLLSIGVNSVAELRGLYQVDLYYPTGEGTANADAMADAIVAAFPRSVQLESGAVNVRVRMVWRQAAQVIDTFYSCPVVVEWTCTE